MKKSTDISIAAMLAALGFVFLFGASIVPTGKIALMCIASACICAVVIKCGIKTAALCGTVICLLGVILMPNKIYPLAFFLVFAYYPCVKSMAERRINARAEIIIKTAYFLITTAFLCGAVYFLKLIPQNTLELIHGFKGLIILWCGAVFCGMIFDRALDILIGFFMRILKQK